MLNENEGLEECMLLYVLKFLMPLVAKFRAVSSSSQKNAINAKKKP